MNSVITKKSDIRSWQKSWLIRVRIAENCYENRDYATGLILDVGCGTKRYKELLKPFNGYIGMDLPQRIARKNHAERRNAIDVYGDALCIPLKDNSVDTIVTFEVLEHIKNPFRAFAEFSRIIKPGGCLILSAPQMYNLHEEPCDFFRYTPYGLTELARGNGFEVIKITSLGGFGTRLAMKLIYLKGGDTLPFLNRIINRIVHSLNANPTTEICHNFLIARKIG